MKIAFWLKLAFVFALAFCNVNRSHAQTAPAPVMTIVQTNTNQILISITNGVANVNYELWSTPVLGDPAYPWEPIVIGTPGQTNWLLDMGPYSLGFYLTVVGSDFDGDGVPNSIDGDPHNASVGALTITIDGPSDGFTFN